MKYFIDQYMFTINSQPSLWANVRLRNRWMQHVSCSIVETQEIILKKRSGILSLYIVTDTAKYPVYVGSKFKRKATELIKKFNAFKQRDLDKLNDVSESRNISDKKEKAEVASELKLGLAIEENFANPNDTSQIRANEDVPAGITDETNNVELIPILTISDIEYNATATSEIIESSTDILDEKLQSDREDLPLDVESEESNLPENVQDENDDENDEKNDADKSPSLKIDQKKSFLDWLE